MRWWTRLRWRQRIEQRLDAELRDHVERQVADYIASGYSEADARRRTAVDFGGLEQIKEYCRDVRGTRWLEELVQDVRCGIRVLRKTPSFTIAAVLSLSLGIGASTAIFALVDTAMLKPLPVKEPERLVELLNDTGNNPPGNAFSYQALVYLREHARTVDIIASHQSEFFVAIDAMPPGLETGQYVTGDFFSVLGVPAVHGRTLGPADGRPGAPPVIVLSHAFWRLRFGGDVSAIGRAVRIDDHPFTIVGVAPSHFRGLVVARAVDFWIPLSTEPLLRHQSRMTDAGNNWLQFVGRVRAGRTLDDARAELSALYRPAVIEPKLAGARDADTRARLDKWRAAVESARAGLAITRQQYGEPLIVLLTISGLVLVIACANVANLLLARAGSRRHEMAVRVSLGAGRARLIRQLLTESLLLSAAGTVLGIKLAYEACDYLVGFFAATRTPITLELGPDVRVLSFAAMLALMTGLSFGVAPAWRAIAPMPPARSLRSRVAGERGRRTLNHILVGGQVALSVVMLFCGGLFLRSLHNIRSAEKGFDSSSVLLINTDASRTRLRAEALRAMYRNVIARIAALPGAESVSLSHLTPIWGGGSEGVLLVDGGPTRHRKGEVSVNRVSPGYFATLGTPISAGRDFGWQDTSDSPKVALVNRTLARRFFVNGDPIGQRVQLRGETFEIIGIAADAKYYGLRGSMPPTLYLHWMQQRDELLENNVTLSQIAVRSRTSPLLLAAPVRAAIQGANPMMAITNVRTFDEQVNASIARERVLSVVSGSFASLGVLLAAIGLYGVMAYTVARRTSEIGIRMALGAQARQIAGMIMREALLVTLGGVIVGIATALVLSRTLATLLFELTPADPMTAAAVIAVMVFAGVIAAYFPSRRAAGIDPACALRIE